MHNAPKWSDTLLLQDFRSVSDHLCIKGLKIKNYEYLTSISKFRYIDKLGGIVNEYSNTYHRTIKLNPVDVESSMYIDFNKENFKS